MLSPGSSTKVNKISAFTDTVDTISVQLEKWKRTAFSDQVILSLRDEGPRIEPVCCHDYLQSLAVNHRKAKFELY
jgi:hypothetical protein